MAKVKQCPKCRCLFKGRNTWCAICLIDNIKYNKTMYEEDEKEEGSSEEESEEVGEEVKEVIDPLTGE